ncbi:gamma-glutamyltranspeptidase [Lasiosphaeria hispida]|uniref:Glutathione hydrolase n=1 Tax=Lasiosphaeria hispida TaxID=260671 RepID=A0AAJ0M9Z7_9PEZI|nr:gamma-glutamyltranspeptidase [Lasiosphaeria hispida]
MTPSSCVTTDSSKSGTFSPLICWLLVLFVQLGPSAAVPLRPQGLFQPPVNGTRGAVACESSICSRIGASMIEIGGTAADAMVASTLCVGVVGMYHSGIGGGGFILVRDTDGQYEFIDYRETAPAAAHRDMYQNDSTASTVGGLAVAVPGELRGLEYLHRKYGVLPWETVVRPAARVAREGFIVGEDLIRYMESVGGNNSFLVSDPVWAEDFAPKGRLVGLGETITRKRYANTLETIAIEGADTFYTGELAKSVLKAAQESGGILTHVDLEQYAIKVKKALSIDYRGYKLFTTQAPSSGPIMLNILNTMKNYPAEDVKNGNLTTHRFVEAMKFAYGARQEFGDPDFIRNTRYLQRQMLTEEKGHQIVSLIQDNQTQPLSVYDPKAIYTTAGAGTSHLVTADRFGMTVSSTTTINLLFGSRVMTPDTGIILNNEMDDFSQPGRRNSFGYDPSTANFIAPGKRPLSSMCPLIVENESDRSVFFTTGAAGGSRIISSTAFTAFNVLERGMSMYDAVAAPRPHDQLMPSQLLVEEGFDESVFESLRAKLHNVTWMGPKSSAVQAIMRLGNGTFDAVGETRQVNSGGSVV